ncbi:hypothetical protein GQ55_9G409300 [Panicum hallii var. hallii]|uniref:Uncharacterized protein n=1 Tax=Panicum hallii var. hallii TaxID=1504633 RepID=A0A2T7CA76_9POAL|nr:hypothetical protein GQ55_9G409300 [Panicum hallii var. hallii]
MSLLPTAAGPQARAAPRFVPAAAGRPRPRPPSRCAPPRYWRAERRPLRRCPSSQLPIVRPAYLCPTVLGQQRRTVPVRHRVPPGWPSPRRRHPSLPRRRVSSVVRACPRRRRRVSSSCIPRRRPRPQPWPCWPRCRAPPRDRWAERAAVPALPVPGRSHARRVLVGSEPPRADRAAGADVVRTSSPWWWCAR